MRLPPVLVLAALLTASCAGGGAASPRELTVAQTPLFTDSTVAIATANGWFASAGLDVDIYEGRSISTLVPPFLTGEIDVLHGGLMPPIAEQMAGGGAMRIVAGGLVLDPAACPSYALVALPGTAIDLSDPEDLMGARIGGPFEGGYLGRWYLERLAERGGLDVADLDTRYVTTADAPATLAAGGVDLLLAAEPALTRLREELGAEVVARVDELLPGTLLTAIYFGPRLLEDPELAARYLAVHLRTVEQHTLGATAENVALLAESSRIEAETLAQACWGAMAPDTVANERTVSEAFDVAARLGLLDSIPTVEQTWDHTVGERARELLEEWRDTILQ